MNQSPEPLSVPTSGARPPRKNRQLTAGAPSTLTSRRPATTHLPSLNSHQDVSRRIPCRVTAVDVHRPPRWHPQCLDDRRSHQHGKGRRVKGTVKGIRGTFQSPELRELCSLECWFRCQQCVSASHRPGRKDGQLRTRLVTLIVGGAGTQAMASFGHRASERAESEWRGIQWVARVAIQAYQDSGSSSQRYIDRLALRYLECHRNDIIIPSEQSSDRITGIIPRATYYGKVGLELGKLIAQQRSMQPP